MDVRGEGSAVILLHSSGMSRRQWRKLAGELSARHRVLAPDFHGSGESPPWPAGQAFDFTADVAAVGELLRAQPGGAHLVGHSYGGLIALRVAREHPGLVRSLSVYDPVAFGVLYAPLDEAGVADLEDAFRHPAFQDPSQRGTEAWLEAFIDYWSGPGAWKAMPDPSRQEFVRVGWQVHAEVTSLLADRTPASAYAPVRAPALLLGGAVSPPAARRVLARLAAILPAATHRELPGAGHMGPLTHGSDVALAIARHVANAESGSPAGR